MSEKNIDLEVKLFSAFYDLRTDDFQNIAFSFYPSLRKKVLHLY